MSSDQQSDDAEKGMAESVESSDFVSLHTSTDDDEFVATGDEEEDGDQVLPVYSDDVDDEEEEGDQLGPMPSEEKKRPRPSPIRQGSIKGELVMISGVLDMQTGKVGGHRARQAVLREQESMEPRSLGERRLQNLTKGLRNSILNLSDERQEPAAAQNRGGHIGVLRNQESTRPRSNNSRRKRNFTKQFSYLFSHHSQSEEESEEEEGEEDDEENNLTIDGQAKVEESVEAGPQYHLEAVHPNQRPRDYIESWLGLGTGGAMYFDDKARGCCFGLTPNNVVMNYLHWSFRSSFAAVFLSAALGFLGWTMLFAFFIWRIGGRHPECIGGVDFETDYFMDAFALSWTTFSTVGYGLIYSGISPEKPDIQKCTGITILVTIEAFFGILFASFCGAIVFGKINRIQSFAQVRFSDPIVIRYGSGVQVEDAHDTDDPEALGSGNSNIPCPVLEFRIVNRLNGTVGGEILDATISLVASIDKNQAQSTRNTQLRRRRGKKGKRKPPRRLQQQTSLRQRGSMRAITTEDSRKEDGFRSMSSSDEDIPPPRPDFFMRRSSRKLSSSINGNTTFPSLTVEQVPSFEEDQTGYLVPKKVFSKLEVESPDHPFFKRVWIVRHRLDQESPLLTTRIRQMVKSNGGNWPAQLNSAEGVRSCVKFDQILVSLSGTSNADANSVYAQKVYEYCDINIGYRFVNLLYRDPVDESLRADVRLINDVVEQAGGGGEAFDVVDRHFGGSLNKMLVL